MELFSRVHVWASSSGGVLVACLVLSISLNIKLSPKDMVTSSSDGEFTSIMTLLVHQFFL